MKTQKISDLQLCSPSFETEKVSNYNRKKASDFCGLNNSWNSKSNCREVSTERSELRETFIEKSFDDHLSELTLMKKELDILNDRLSENQKQIADQKNENMKALNQLKSFKNAKKQKCIGLCECGII